MNMTVPIERQDILEALACELDRQDVKEFESISQVMPKWWLKMYDEVGTDVKYLLKMTNGGRL